MFGRNNKLRAHMKKEITSFLLNLKAGEHPLEERKEKNCSHEGKVEGKGGRTNETSTLRVSFEMHPFSTWGVGSTFLKDQNGRGGGEKGRTK